MHAHPLLRLPATRFSSCKVEGFIHAEMDCDRVEMAPRLIPSACAAGCHSIAIETSVSSLCAFCTTVAFHSLRVILRAGGLAGQAGRCCPFTAVSVSEGSFLDVHRLLCTASWLCSVSWTWQQADISVSVRTVGISIQRQRACLVFCLGCRVFKQPLFCISGEPHVSKRRGRSVLSLPVQNLDEHAHENVVCLPSCSSLVLEHRASDCRRLTC